MERSGLVHGGLSPARETQPGHHIASLTIFPPWWIFSGCKSLPEKDSRFESKLRPQSRSSLCTLSSLCVEQMVLSTVDQAAARLVTHIRVDRVTLWLAAQFKATLGLEHMDKLLSTSRRVPVLRRHPSE